MENNEQERFDAARILGNLKVWQDSLQGQIEAVRVALFAMLHVAQSNPELRQAVESNLHARIELMRGGQQDTEAVVLGFEAASRELLSAFHIGNPDDAKH